MQEEEKKPIELTEEEAKKAAEQVGELIKWYDEELAEIKHSNKLKAMRLKKEIEELPEGDYRKVQRKAEFETMPKIVWDSGVLGTYRKKVDKKD